MKHMVLAIALVASPALATPSDDTLGAMAGADLIFLGETHDNPAHHARQAEVTAAIGASALVFEMLTPDQAARVTPALRGDPQALAETLGWADSGWPDFDMYYPIFAAAPSAVIYGGAVPREAARAAMGDGVVAWFGADEAAAYGLDRPLTEPEQEAREAMQMRAHCDALPESMLPMMVDIQRLRDAALARAAVQAFDDTGGPVVVIAGNGHARADRGAPVYVAHARPDLVVASLGQSEEGALDGVFDARADSPRVDRGDPCAAFSKAEKPDG